MQTRGLVQGEQSTEGMPRALSRSLRDRHEDRPETPVLEVKDLDVFYGSVQILFGVELSLAQGEVLAVLGTNGAGKSTLLRSISGLTQPTAGSVRLDGQDISSLPTHKRSQLGLVHLAGGNAVFPGLSVEDNLRVGSFTFLNNRHRVAAGFERVFDLFPPLRDRRSQLAGSMSGGEQQMVALAMALLQDPLLLLIDELSLGLAPAVVGQLLSVLEQLKREERLSMLVVEQSLNLAISFADRAVFLEKGEIRFSGPPDELLDKGDLVRAVFLGGLR